MENEVREVKFLILFILSFGRLQTSISKNLFLRERLYIVNKQYYKEKSGSYTSSATLKFIIFNLMLQTFSGISIVCRITLKNIIYFNKVWSLHQLLSANNAIFVCLNY